MLAIWGGGVVAELFVLASPELNPDEPFRLLLHPGLTIKSVVDSRLFLNESTFQFPGLLNGQKERRYFCIYLLIGNVTNFSTVACEALLEDSAGDLAQCDLQPRHTPRS
jgi:hypothetical protein